jgi:hypothetical protein
VLTVTSATDNSTPQVTFDATPGITLATSYAATASSFTPSGDATKRFYGNVKADDLSYANNFNLLFVYSDKDTDVAVSKPSTQYVAGSATSAMVPASNMTLDLSEIQFDTDAAGIVTGNSAGNAHLNAAAAAPIMGDHYVIVDGPLPTSWKAIDDAYIAGSNFNGYQPNGTHQTVVNGGNIPDLFFVKIGDALPRTRVLIVQHLDPNGTGISSYQTFTISFVP